MRARGYIKGKERFLFSLKAHSGERENLSWAFWRGLVVVQSPDRATPATDGLRTLRLLCRAAIVPGRMAQPFSRDLSSSRARHRHEVCAIPPSPPDHPRVFDVTLPFSRSVVRPQIAKRVLRAGEQVFEVHRHLVHVFVVAENFHEDAAFAFAANPAQPVIAIGAS